MSLSQLNKKKSSLNHKDVEEILAKDTTQQGVSYLIRWKGSSRLQDYTWEPVSQLADMMLMIDEFEEKYCPNGETKFIRYPNVKRNVDSKKHKERSENNIFMTGQQKVKETYNVDPKLSAVTNNVKSSLQLSSQDCQQKISSAGTSPKQKEWAIQRIVNHTFRDGQLHYEISTVDKNGKNNGIRILESSEIKEKDSKVLLEYLQSFLIEVQKQF